MANPEHLKILRQGVEVWNRWRVENPESEPSLSEARLRRANLRGANLRGANLRGARLDRADLDSADLTGANFNGASLVGANLQSATLVRTDLCALLAEASLRVANLTGAYLSGANLILADLTGANLIQAYLGEARIGSTAIANVDLSQTVSLERVAHDASSPIATSTLERTAVGLANDPSQQAEVEFFFRRAGVSEALMDAFVEMIGHPSEFYSLFISYSHADKIFAGRLHEQLQARGIRCWLDKHDMKPGDRIIDVVNEAIRLHDKILLCCSESSLNSWWVKDEIEKALERERREGRDIIIPLNLDGYLLDGWESGQASTIRSRLAADFNGWEHANAKFDEQFERVVLALRTDKGAAPK